MKRKVLTTLNAEEFLEHKDNFFARTGLRKMLRLR